jgi:intein/homing endonuclease
MKPRQLKEYLKQTLVNMPNRVTYIYGGVGVGKSSVVAQTCQELGFEMRDIRLSLLDATDLRGLPAVDKEKRETIWTRPQFLPAEDYDKDVVLFFDEFSNANGNIQNACFVGDTFIAGETFKKIKDIKIGDKVIDKNGEQKKVTEKFELNYDGSLYTIKANNLLPINATAEHPFLVIKKYRKQNLKYNIKENISNVEWVEAKNLKNGYYMGIPKLQPLDYENKIKINPESEGLNIPKNIECVLNLNEKIAKLIGYYVAEGCYGNSNIQLSFGKHEEKTLAKETKEIFEHELGLQAKIIIRGSSACVVAYSTFFGNWLKIECGAGASNKKIPNCILYNKDEKILLAFLRGYFAGDGNIYKEKNNRDYYHVVCATASEILARQVQLAFTRFNLIPNICIRDVVGKQSEIIYNDKKRVIVCKFKCFAVGSSDVKMLNLFDINIKRKRDTHSFFEKDNILWVKIKNIKQEQYKGLVYNLEVEDTHTYLAENCIVHNCLQLLLDRQLGEYKLPKKARIICAGNRITDGGFVFRIGSANSNRLINIEFETDFDDWKEWAYANNVDPLIVAFHNWKNGTLLTNYAPSMNTMAFASPRSWYFVHELMKAGITNGTLYEAIKGAIGEGAGTEFYGFMKIFRDLPDVKEIMENNKNIIPQESNILYALTGALINYIRGNKTKMDRLVEYSLLIPKEFSVLLIKDLLKTELKEDVMKNKTFDSWVEVNKEIIL